MEKIKLTKGELKRQRDTLQQYERYLPTLQLKKQQLQMEIIRQLLLLEEKRRLEVNKIKTALAWAGLLSEEKKSIQSWIRPKEVVLGSRNIAGVNLPVLERLEFNTLDYDLFLFAPWIDTAIEVLKDIVNAREEIKAMEDGVAILRQELRITTQRVNLFEKVKIPQSQEAIRLIKIYIGDQMANAVGRSKIAKRKIEEFALEGAAA